LQKLTFQKLTINQSLISVKNYTVIIV